MYVSSYLERLKIQLAALALEEYLEIPDCSEVLNAWADMDTGEQLDVHKPVGRWLCLTVTPYEEFCVWLNQHGITAYFQEHGSVMIFVRVRVERMQFDRLAAEIPPLYDGLEQTPYFLIQALIGQSIDMLGIWRSGRCAQGLARIFIQIIMLSHRLKIDLTTALFNELVSDRLGTVEKPEAIVPMRR